MSTLSWGSVGTHNYQSGVDRGVLFPPSGSGVPWNGLISVSEDDDFDTIVNEQDGHSYISKQLLGSYSALIEAFSYPVEFENHDGMSKNVSHQSRTPFGFSYRTLLGNDIDSSLGYQIHIIYNALAAPASKSYSSDAEQTDVITFGWNISTKPVKIDGVSPSAHYIIDSTKAYPWVLSQIEGILYGTEVTNSRLPTLEELFEVFEAGAILKITNHDDGSWTAEGPDDVVTMTDATSFMIDWPSVIYLSEDTYRVSSL